MGRDLSHFSLTRLTRKLKVWPSKIIYFCTSSNLGHRNTVTAFSCPSTTLSCNAEYNSLKGIGVGDAPKSLTICIYSGLSIVLIFSPLRSAGVRNGRLLFDKFRHPTFSL